MPGEAVDALLGRVLPRAATLFERLEGVWLEPQAGDSQSRAGSARWERWAERVRAGDRAAFERLLERRGIDVADARGALEPMRVRVDAPLPDWAAVLGELLRSAAAPPAPEGLRLASAITAGGTVPLVDAETIPVREGFAAPALAAFLPWARERMGDRAALFPGIAHDLSASLLRQLLVFSLPCLRGVADTVFAADCAPLEGWSAILERSPALGRALGVVAANWARFAGELLERLAVDRRELGLLLADTEGSPPPTPVACGPVGGDRHDDGRCVTPIEFEGGGLLYYKPKDLRLGDALAALVTGLDVDLVLPRRLTRPDYVFEEAVEERTPSSRDGWARVAHQLGMWIRLFDVLGAGDLLRTNVLVAGDDLVPIDTETIVPFLFVPDTLPWLPAGSRLGLLTAPLVTRSEGKVENYGILADGSNAPLLDHLDTMVDGFTAMHRRLVERRSELLLEVETWAALPARALIRNSWVYFRLLIDSLSREAMEDGVERDLVLERLWRVQLRAGLADPLIEAETAALRDLDVPLFRFAAGGTDIVGPGGRVAPDVLHDPPLTGLRKRLNALAAEPDPADLEGLRALAFCAAPAHRADTGAPAERRTDVRRPTDWAEEARRVGFELLGFLRTGGPGGARLRAGLTYVPHNAVFALSAERPPDVLSGAGGIALVLAELAANAAPNGSALESELVAEAALLAREARERGRGTLSDLERWLETGTDAPLCGVHWGLPAWLYTLCALPPEIVGSGAERELDEAMQLLAALDPALAWPERRLVPVAGLLLAVEAVAESRERRGAAEDAALGGIRDRLRAHLVERWERPWLDASVEPTLAGTLPSPHGAAALALWRHARNARSELPAAAAAWRDEGGAEAEGDRLVRLALGGQPGPPPAADTSLGWLDSLVAATAAQRAHADPDAEGRAVAAAEQLRARKERFGRWFPESHADRFRLSAVWGVAGIAHAFCALASPERAWSLRLLELPPEPSTGRSA
jgi:hypothetical protein